MTEKGIIEGNKLIGEFMDDDGTLCYYKGLDGPQYESGMYLKYNKSWDWLMPIVEKIESIYDDFHGYFGVYISSNSCTIQGTRLNTSIENPHYAYHNDVTLNTKIESTWYAVVQFIQWYNTQQ
jgi:hypothetical protein